MKFIGYARVEKEGDDLHAQLDQLKQCTTDNYFDIYHGNDFKGAELSRIMFLLNRNLTLIVPELKTITNNVNELLKFMFLVKQKNMNFISLKENLNTNKEDGQQTIKVFSDLYQSYFGDVVYVNTLVKNDKNEHPKNKK